MRTRVAIDTALEAFAALDEFLPDLKVVGIIVLEKKISQLRLRRRKHCYPQLLPEVFSARGCPHHQRQRRPYVCAVEE